MAELPEKAAAENFVAVTSSLPTMAATTETVVSAAIGTILDLASAPAHSRGAYSACDPLCRTRSRTTHCGILRRNRIHGLPETSETIRCHDARCTGAHTSPDRMSLDIRWLLPVAIYAVAPQCIAAKYM